MAPAPQAGSQTVIGLSDGRDSKLPTVNFAMRSSVAQVVMWRSDSNSLFSTSAHLFAPHNSDTYLQTSVFPQRRRFLLCLKIYSRGLLTIEWETMIVWNERLPVKYRIVLTLN
jgi:hypothetical protein